MKILKKSLIAIKMRSAFVDAVYYASRYPDLKEVLLLESASSHFRRVGWKEGRSPSENFDPITYLCANGDFSQSRRTIISRGVAENVAQNLPRQLAVFLTNYGAVQDSGHFDEDFYRSAHPGVVGDLVEHYLRHGWKLGMEPSASFSGTRYLRQYPDVELAGINPLVHYATRGLNEGRQAFSASGLALAPGLGAGATCPPIEVHRAAVSEALRQKLLNPTLRVFEVDGPLISLLVPVYDVADRWIDEMVSSVLCQSYRHWELCLVDDASPDDRVRQNLRRLEGLDPRIVVQYRTSNGGISAATNDALAMASGEYVALLDNDDLLTFDALEEMVKSIIDQDQPDWLYSDEFKIDERNNVSELFAKPDWSPSMLLNYMYTGHFTLYKRDVVKSVGGFRSAFDFSQDYDLALRISEIPDVRVCHVEKYLYGWRMITTSAAMGGKPTARLSNIAALQDAVDRRGWKGIAEALPTANRVNRTDVVGGGVSIIIPSDNPINISAAVRSITDNTLYQDYQIVVVTNSGVIEELSGDDFSGEIIWEAYDLPFNFSDKCNRGADVASGSYLIFFNDDVRVITTDWIEVMLEHGTLPGVGVVGPKLLYENGLIQHGGMGTGMRRLVGTVFHCYEQDTGAHFNFAQCVRDVSIICGALLGIPAQVFAQIGGFDAVNAPIGHSDVDLCFRVRELGLRCVYTPYAKMMHIGHVSIGEEKKASKGFRIDKSDVFLLERFGRFVARDPYFTPAMQKLIFMDSPEAFEVFPGKGLAIKGERPRDILILSHDLTISGAPKIAFDLALQFREKGFFVTVAAPDDGPYRDMLEREGITVVIDALVLTGHESSMVLGRSFDMVIANTIVCWRAVEVLAKTTPVYVYSHETELVAHFAQAEPDFVPALRSATEVWCGSERAAAAMKTLGIDVHIVEYGVSDIATETPEEPRLKISLFGSFEERKAQDLAVLGVAAMPQAARRRVKLTLYGRVLNRDFRRQVEKIAEDVPEINFGGSLQYDQYIAELKDSDIILVCSRDDTLPLVSLDALAMGKPLVCSRTTGTSKYLEDGVSALLLEENSGQEIGAALARLIDSESLRAHLGKNARAVFESVFTQEAFERRVAARLPATAPRST